MLIGHPPGAAGRFAEGVWPLPGRNIRCCGYSASSVRGLALVSPWPATGSTKASGHYPTAGS